MPRCFNCRKKFESKRFLQKHCEKPECVALFREGVLEKNKNATKSKPKSIKRVSDKRVLDDIIYESERIKFLQLPANKICFIEGCNREANTIEHIAGRKGFYDDWARDNKISLYIDVRFWKPCCLHHNLELENNPELSKQYQLSKIHGGNKL